MLLVEEGYEAFGVLVMETTDSLVQGKGLYHIQPFKSVYVSQQSVWTEDPEVFW